MATYYWVGGTGTWSGTGNTQFATTSGGIATALNPTAADTVNFDANSGTAATVTVTSTAVSLSTTINKADINLSLSGSPTLCTAAGILTLTTGIITLNTFTLTVGRFSSTNSNTRTLAFGTGKIVVTGVNVTIFNIGTSTNMTVSGTNPLVEATGAGTSLQSRGIAMGRTFSTPEAYSISFTVNNGADLISFSGGGAAFRNVSFVGFTGTFTIAQNQIVYGNWNFGGVTSMTGTASITFAATSGTKTITSNSVTFTNPIIFNGVGGTWQLQDAMTIDSTVITTLTNGTLNLNGYTLTTGSFYSDNSNIRVLAFGTGKIVVTSNNSAPFNVDNALNFSYTGTSNIEAYYTGAVGVRYLVIGNTTGGSEAVAMNLKVTVGTDTVYIYKYWNNVDFTGFAGVYGYLGFKIFYGSLTLVSGMYVEPPLTGETITFAATSGPKTITSAGNTIDYPVTFDGVGGTWAMQDAFTLGSTRTLTFTNGTVQLKSGTTSTVGSFVTTGTNQKFLQSTTPGSQATLSAASGINTVSYLTIQDIAATGGATWNAYSTDNNINAGNNTGWDFFAQLSRYIYTRRKNKVISI